MTTRDKSGTRACARATLSEAAIQLSIVNYLRTTLTDCLVFAIPNASRRTAGGRAGNAVAGLLPGVPDLCIVAPIGCSYWIEVKRIGGKLSTAQEGVLFHFAKYGIPYCVAQSIDDARVAVQAWKLNTREAA